MSVPRMMTPAGRIGKSGCLYGRSDSLRPCALYAARNRIEMTPMDTQTSSAEIPVMLSGHVKTMPAPQIVVRNVRQENASDSLGVKC